MTTKHRFQRFSFAAGFCLLTAAALSAQGPPQTGNQEQNIDAYVDLLRQDVRTQKVAIIGQMMQFTPEEASKFWPIYSDYATELTELGNRRFEVIKDYADNYGSLSDAKADELISKALDLKDQKNAVLRKYYQKVRDAFSAKLAA
ncbi:MAG: hypothetical protein GY953_26780, partial [bacterium]|nr:hypothetical protein [bacterium]